MKEIYTPEQEKLHVDNVLKNGLYCHLGMSDKNMPYIVTVNFGYDNDFIYFHSSQTGKKTRILITNPNICFQVNSYAKIHSGSQACNWGTKFRSIIGYGKAELLEDDDQKKKALNAIMLKYSGTSKHEFNDHIIGRTNVYRIPLLEVTARQNRMGWMNEIMSE